MASTGNVFPTAGVNVDRAGNTAWTNPGNVVSDNTTDATVVVPSDYLVTSAYAFSAIPTNAVIGGVTVRVEASESGAASSDYIPQLHSDTTPTLIGSAKSAVAVSGTTKVISTSGGTTDLWGATLTANIIHGSGFGVSIWSADTINTLAVDFITIAIEYTVPTPGRSDEASSAYALGRVKIRPMGLATETDSSYAPTKAKLKATGRSTETDTSVKAFQKIVAVGRANEIDTSDSVYGKSTGFSPPTVGANVAGVDADWVNPTNIYTSNDSYASAAGAPTDYLVASSFGFTAIPTNAKILGITLKLEANRTVANVNVTFGPISDTTPTPIGTPVLVSITSGTDAVFTVGSQSDLWGASVTPAMVHATGFGAYLYSGDEVPTTNIFVDQILVAVQYLVPLWPRVTEADTAYAPTVANVFAGHTVATGLATEVDTSAALGKVKIRAAGLSSEADTSAALGKVKIRAAGLSSEADTSAALGKVKIRATGLCAEADTARALGRVTFRAAGRATEADSAFSVTRVKVKAAGLSSETDSAFTVTRVKIRSAGLSTEADSAFTVTRVKARATGLSTEADAAFTITKTKIRATGRSDEADSAFTVGKALGHQKSLETDTAYALGLVGHLIVGLATEADSAFTVGKALGHQKSLEADSAAALGKVKLRSVGRSNETDSAFTVGKAFGHGESAELDTAAAPALQKNRAVGLASETETAFAQTHAKNRATGLSSEADSALVLTHVKLNATGLATEIDTAYSRFGATADVGRANETDVASAPHTGRIHPYPILMCEEADSCFTRYRPGAGFVRNIGTGRCLEDELALAPSMLRIYYPGLSLEADSVGYPGFFTGRADEDDSAPPIQVSHAITGILASESDSAYELTRIEGVAFGLAEEVDVPIALWVNRFHAYAIGSATEADSANAPHIPDLLFTGRSDETDTSFTLARPIVRHALTSSELDTANALGLTGGILPHNNMPPYFVAYIWARTA